MYDSNGIWQKQKVHFGYLQDGTPGLFTGHFLACHLAEGENPKAVAERMGFEFVEVKGD